MDSVHETVDDSDFERQNTTPAQTAENSNAWAMGPPTSLTHTQVESNESLPETALTPPIQSHSSATGMRKFSMKQSDVPPTLILEGKRSEDVPAILGAFLNRVRIHAPDDGAESTVQRHAIKHLPLILRGSAEKLYTPLGSGKVDWRPPAVIQDLKARGKDRGMPR